MRPPFLHLGRIEDDLFQKYTVGFDSGQHLLEPGRTAPKRRHLQRLGGCFEFVPGLPVLEPIPQSIPICEIGQSTIQWLLAAAHAHLQMLKE